MSEYDDRESREKGNSLMSQDNLMVVNDEEIDMLIADILEYAENIKKAFPKEGMKSNKWSQRPDSNRRPAHYECAALPTELRWPLFGADNGIRTRDP